jgi:Tat protein secretion system quality control protein TatD with DNase activity
MAIESSGLTVLDRRYLLLSANRESGVNVNGNPRAGLTDNHIASGSPIIRIASIRLIAGALLLVMCGAVPSVGAQGRTQAAFSDAHVHLNDPVTWVGLMDQTGVDRAVGLAGRDIGNSMLLEAARQWPGRIFPFVSVSPEHRDFRAAWETDDERLAPLVDSLLQQGGFYGIGEISVTHFPGTGFPEADFNPGGRTMRSLLQLARKHNVPIMVHAEITRLREFEALLADFRDVTVIWAHGGYTQLYMAKRLLEANPNLIYELSARTWASHPRSPDYTIFQNEMKVWPEWLELVEAMPARFLVGTDASVRSEPREREKIGRVQLFLDQLSDPARRRVARENLSRILSLSN